MVWMWAKEACTRRSSRCRTAGATIGMPGVGARPQGGGVVPDMARGRSIESRSKRIESYGVLRAKEDENREIKSVK